MPEHAGPRPGAGSVPPRRKTWPVRSGTIPLVAGGFTHRPETGPGPWDALRPGATVVLGPADPGDPAGTGKTHLAAAFAERLWAAGQLDLLAWLDAGSRDAIVSGYARALTDVRVAAPAGRPEAAAGRFLAWLSATSRRWLVVLDGLADPADADGLWPHGPAGQVLVTTGLPGVRPHPAPAAAADRDARRVREHQEIGLPAFSQREALSYLSDRLNDDHYQVAGALDLASGLGCLPAGLSLAVTYLLDSGQDCRQYRQACDRYRRQPGQTAGDPLAPAWMLAMERVMPLPPAGLAWPALKLAAVLGPAGVPGTVLTSAAACGYVTGQPQVT
ncbi:MAG TPA: ATP-binding protein, partial [Streptosporangiaceae bacterium]|nr:ATP-binding protein [Streptosporangiaceae bacterium]